MEGDCNVYAHSSLWMRPTQPDRYNAKIVYKFKECYALWIHFVMWMQQGYIWHLGKIEFSVDLETTGTTCKNTQLKTEFKSNVKVILLLWKK